MKPWLVTVGIYIDTRTTRWNLDCCSFSRAKTVDHTYSVDVLNCTCAQKRASAKTARSPSIQIWQNLRTKLKILYVSIMESKSFVPLSLLSLSISRTRHNIHDFHPKCLKGGVAATVIFLSASTTAALHWSFVSPYIHKLKWKPGSETFDVEMVGNVYSKDDLSSLM